MRGLREKCLFCEWWVVMQTYQQTSQRKVWGVCKHDPSPIETACNHWCSQFREFNHPDVKKMKQVIKQNKDALESAALRDVFYGTSEYSRAAEGKQGWVEFMI